jgi:uncharacterized FlaG/YvyC family protein
MSFDGLPHPITTDVLNPYSAANAAKTDNAGRPLIQKTRHKDHIQPIQREEETRSGPDEEDDTSYFSEEEADQIQRMAKLRGLMNFSLQNGVHYEFRFNPKTGLIDLIQGNTGDCVLQLHPDEFMNLSQKIQRYAGMLTDRNG